jgi:phospholipid/cholesterol/gamma-HCH transport system substrate-binding protein
MATSLVKLKVGVTFLIAAGILFIGILWLKEYNPFLNAVPMRVVFVDSNGIRSGDPVTVSGIKIGEVSRVSLTPDNRAMVELTVARSVQLHPDASFTVIDVGMMGDKAMTIEAGTAPGRLDMNEVHSGVAGPGLNSLMGEAGDLVGKLSRTVARIDSGLDVAELTGSLEETLLKVREVAVEYRKLARDTGGPLNGALDRFGSAADDIRGFVRENGEVASQAIESMKTTSERFTALIDTLGAVSTVIDTLASRIETGNGTFAKLVKSDSLYEELRHTNAAVDSFVSDFRRQPGKYTKDMKFKVRLF